MLHLSASWLSLSAVCRYNPGVALWLALVYAGRLLCAGHHCMLDVVVCWISLYAGCRCMLYVAICCMSLYAVCRYMLYVAICCMSLYAGRLFNPDGCCMLAVVVCWTSLYAGRR